MLTVRDVHFEITDRCNSGCPQCVRTNPQTTQAWDYVSNKDCSLEQFKEISPPSFLKSIKFAYFCGNYGDPLLAKDLFEILQYCYETNPKLSVKVHSNCSVRSKDWWQKLGIYTQNKKFKLVASIDGTNQNSQAIYRIRTDFNKIMNNLKVFIDAGGKAEWRFITFAHNEHEVPIAQKMSETMGFVNFKSYASNRFFGQDSYTYFDDGAMKTLYPSTLQKKKFIDTKQIPIQQLLSQPPVQFKINCQAIQTSSIFIDYEGNILPCCHFGIRLYTLRRGVSDVNKDPYVYDILNDFGVEKLNIYYVGFDNALVNCGLFLESLKAHWHKSEPFVCRMICGKNAAYNINQ